MVLIMLGKLDMHMQKNETEPLSYTLIKYVLKMDLKWKL